MRIGDTLTYPTYKEIHNFLEYRVRALAAIAPPSTKKSSKQTGPSKGDGTHTKSHLSTTAKCCECNILQFKAESIEQRQRLVREKGLCVNCLSSGHKLPQCPSKYTCHTCKKRHHSLHHNSDHQRNVKGESNQLSFPAGGTLPKSTPIEMSTPQQSPSSSQHVVATDETLLTVEPKIAPASIMLATA